MTSETKTVFPYDVLTPLPNARPTVTSLLLLNQEITANAVSVYSFGGNGDLGHYPLVTDAATYLAASNNVAIVAPVHPGANPIHVVGETAAVITETNRRFAADLLEFNTYRTTDAVLEKQLIAAVPGTYINSLKQLGFANVTTLKILQHLQQTYGTLTVDELTTNIKSPNDSIEMLFEQIRESMLFAATTDPISESTALRSALENVEKFGVFGDAVRDFRKQLEANKTYNNFIEVNLADAERRRLMATKSAGYHTAATAINTSEKALAANENHKTETVRGVYYCWTHGVGFNKDHTSGTCNAPQSGHRIEAVITNMMGGNNFERRQHGEKQVYIPPVSKGKNAPKLTAAAASENS
jgi:hypothetical protein